MYTWAFDTLVALETGQARSGDLRLALREHVAEHHLAVEGLHAVGLVVPAAAWVPAVSTIARPRVTLQ